MLSQKPLHIRKRIAVTFTLLVACVLVVLLIFFNAKKESAPRPNTDHLRQFYKTISDTTQSFFEAN